MHTESPIWLNRYVVVLLLFIGWMLFFDDNNIFRQIKQRQEVNNLREQLRAIREELRSDSLFLEELKNNPAIKEKIAREKYLMKRDNEIVFSIIRESPPENPAGNPIEAVDP